MATVKKVKQPTVYKDKLGQELAKGDYVAGCHRNTMYICRILKINNVMLRIVDIKDKSGRYEKDGWLVYPSETVKLSGESALAYILKYA